MEQAARMEARDAMTRRRNECSFSTLPGRGRWEANDALTSLRNAAPLGRQVVRRVVVALERLMQQPVAREVAEDLARARGTLDAEHPCDLGGGAGRLVAQVVRDVVHGFEAAQLPVTLRG